MTEEKDIPANKSVRILVVDDEADSRKLLTEILSQNGYQVDAVSTGEEALEKALHDAYDIVLVDLIMPGIDGYEVCDRLRTNRKTEEIPIIVVSGRSDWVEDIRIAFDVGANDYIVKTDVAGALPNKIKRCLVVARGKSGGQ